MLVSVIIPVFNAEKFIRQSVESILNQSISNLQILICDDCSTDNSYKEIENIGDSRVEYFQNRKNLGYQKTINFLFKQAKGNFIAFQDADDISHPKRLELQLKKIEDEGLDLVGTNYQIIDIHDQTIRLHLAVNENSNWIKSNLVNHNFFQKPSILFKSEILKNIGGYRLELLEYDIISEDYDWLLRINEKDYKLSNVNYNEPLYSYRAVETAMTKNVQKIGQFFGHDIVRYLAKQRVSEGKDCIETGNTEQLHKFVQELRIPFEEDSSLFHRKMAKHLMYSDLKLSAMRASWQALLKNPFLLKNYYMLQYCLRKWLTSL